MSTATHVDGAAGLCPVFPSAAPAGFLWNFPSIRDRNGIAPVGTLMNVMF